MRILRKVKQKCNARICLLSFLNWKVFALIFFHYYLFRTFVFLQTFDSCYIRSRLKCTGNGSVQKKKEKKGGLMVQGCFRLLKTTYTTHSASDKLVKQLFKLSNMYKVNEVQMN